MEAERWSLLDGGGWKEGYGARPILEVLVDNARGEKLNERKTRCVYHDPRSRSSRDLHTSLVCARARHALSRSVSVLCGCTLRSPALSGVASAQRAARAPEGGGDGGARRETCVGSVGYAAFVRVSDLCVKMFVSLVAAKQTAERTSRKTWGPLPVSPPPRSGHNLPSQPVSQL